MNELDRAVEREIELQDFETFEIGEDDEQN